MKGAAKDLFSKSRAAQAFLEELVTNLKNQETARMLQWPPSVFKVHFMVYLRC